MRKVEKQEEKIVIGGGGDNTPPHFNFKLPWPFGGPPIKEQQPEKAGFDN